jgi:hypothetical protein
VVAGAAGAKSIQEPQGHRALTPRLKVEPETAVLLGLASLALGLVVYFDLASNLAFGDEWVYRWTAQRLATGHGLHLWPQVLAVSLVQTLASMPVAILRAEPRFLRLTVLPFLVLWSVMSRLIAQRLGAGRFWSAAAAVVVPLAPLSLWVSVSFMSDIAYVALLMSAVWFGLRWISDGRGTWWFILLTALATSQRQQGIALAVGVTAVVLLRRQPLLRGDLLALAATWVAATAALLFPFVSGIASDTETQVLHNQGTQHLSLGSAVGSALELAPMLGLLLLPLAVGLLRRPNTERLPAGRWELIPLILAIAGLVAAAMFAAFFGFSIWPGDVWDFYGRGPLTLGGAKPAIFGLWAFLLLEALVVIVFLVLLGWRRRLWAPRALGSSGTFLVLLALAHLVPMALTAPVDRYYIPVAAVLAPFLAAQVSRVEAPGWGMAAARVWPIATLAAGLGLFVAEQQDYLAWQTARAQAQARAYAMVGPAGVDAGYEANGPGLAIPRYEQTGELVDPVHLTGLDPSLALRFASLGDPRPGVDYSSLASGKIVIVCVHPARCRLGP